MKTAALESLSDRIALLVERRTSGRVRNLRVEINRDRVRLSGCCASFYTKQLAQHAAMQLAQHAAMQLAQHAAMQASAGGPLDGARDMRLVNAIQVA